MEQHFADILNYCNDNIKGFENRLNRAFCRHFEQRIPLYLASESLTLAVQDCIDEWCDCEEVDSDLIDVEEFLDWASNEI